MITKRLLPLVMILLATTVVACGGADLLTYIPEGGQYAESDLPGLLAAADLEKVAETGIDDAAGVRTKALEELRTHGDEPALLADTLTSDFPVDTVSVPVYVERGTYDDAPAWIVIEAAPDQAGTLSYRRLWVFSASERAVVAALSSR